MTFLYFAFYFIDLHSGFAYFNFSLCFSFVFSLFSLLKVQSDVIDLTPFFLTNICIW